MNAAFRTLSAAVLLAVNASALTVNQYSAASHERFATGSFGGATNPSFFLSKYDLSGIGVSSSGFNVTLISPRHFITARHVSLSVGSTVSFINAAGQQKTYTIASFRGAYHPTTGQESDCAIGSLTEAIPADAGITYYPVLTLSAISQYKNIPFAAFGANQRAGVNSAALASEVDHIGSDGIKDSFSYTLAYETSKAGDTQAQNGDSGSPIFTVIHGELVLVGPTVRISGSFYTIGLSAGMHREDLKQVLNAAGFPLETYTAGATAGTYILNYE